MRAKTLSIGLEQTLEADLERAVAALDHSITAVPFVSARECIRAIDRTAADLVFCGSEDSSYESLLEALRGAGREVPVVIVSRVPEIDRWLDAMDSGACDYCAPPFEPQLIRSVIENSLRARTARALAV